MYKAYYTVDQAEVAHYEPPHLDLLCLQTESFSFLALQGLKFKLCAFEIENKNIAIHERL